MSETSRTYTQEGEEDQDRQLDSMDGEGMELDQESDDGPERSDFIIQRPSLSSLLGDEMESLGDDSRPRAGSLIQLTFSGAPTRTVYPLYQGFNIIGREPPEGEVKLDGPHVTSKHAIIEMTNERFHFVQDLTTTNGTFVYPLSLDSARGGRRPNTSQPRSEPSMGSPSQLDVHATFGPALKIKPSVRGQSNRYQILHGTVVRFADVMCRFEVAPRWRNGWDREIDGLNPVTGINGISEVGAGDEESTPIHSRSGLSPVSSRPIRQPNFIADSQELLNSARTGGRVVFGDVPSPKPSSPGPVSVHTNDVQDKEKGALEENRMAWSQDLVQDGEEVAIPNVEQPLVDNVVEGSSHRPRGGRRAGGSRGRGRGRERSLAPRRSEDPVRGEEGSDTEGEEDAMSSSDVKVVKDNVRQNAGSTPHSPMQPGSPTIQEQLPVQQEDGGAESDVSESLLAPSKPRRPIKATDEAAASVAVDKKSGKRKKQSLVEEEHSKEEETTKSHSEKGKSGANADAESGHESEHSNRGRTLRGRGRGGLRGRGRGKLASHVSVSQGMDITEAEDEIVTGVKEDLSESANAKSTARKALQSKAGNHINVNIEEPDAAEDHEAEVPGSKRKRKSVPSSAAEGSDEKVAADVKVKKPKSSLGQTGKVKVVFSGLQSPDDGEAARLAHYLKFEVVETVKKATHLVTDTKIKRTVKFLAALSEGKPIVSLSWLDECKRKGGVVDAASFILNDPAAETKWGFKLAESLASSAEKEGKLLDGREFFITPNTKPGNGDLKEIVEAAGGKVHKALTAKTPTPGHSLVVLGCDEDRARCADLASKGFDVRINEYVLTAILRQEIDEEAFKMEFQDVVQNSASVKRKGKK